jgi:hypothetical protein
VNVPRRGGSCAVFLLGRMGAGQPRSWGARSESLALGSELDSERAWGLALDSERAWGCLRNTAGGG